MPLVKVEMLEGKSKEVIIWREFFLLDLKGKIMLPANW